MSLDHLDVGLLWSSHWLPCLLVEASHIAWPTVVEMRCDFSKSSVCLCLCLTCRSCRHVPGNTPLAWRPCMAMHLLCCPGWIVFFICKSYHVSLYHALASLSREGHPHTAISKDGVIHSPHRCRRSHMILGFPPCLPTHADLDPFLFDLGTRLTWTRHGSCQLLSDESKWGGCVWR